MASNVTVQFPKPMKATSNGVFQGDNPLHFALPLAILQICLVVLLTRVLAYFLRPLRQPRVIAEIIVSPHPLLSSPSISSICFQFDRVHYSTVVHNHISMEIKTFYIQLGFIGAPCRLEVVTFHLDAGRRSYRQEIFVHPELPNTRGRGHSEEA
ncbi:hypothetical protein U1Q18_021181 [Sarracenia purpurea var. burkii]